MAPNFHEASTRNCFVTAESVSDDLHFLLNRSMESKRVRSSIVMRKSRRTNSGLDTSTN